MKRSGSARWHGNLQNGEGTLALQSGAFDNQPYSYKSRFTDESGQSGTNPEELIAAAHAGCFAMQLSHFLAVDGTPADALQVEAQVELIPGTGIVGSALTLQGRVPGIDEVRFRALAEKAKNECAVSRALGAIKITLAATLV